MGFLLKMIYKWVFLYVSLQEDQEGEFQLHHITSHKISQDFSKKTYGEQPKQP